MASESTEQKGKRLANDGRVTHDENAQVYAVEGFTGLYMVIVFGSGKTWCSCPTRGQCSHMLAVKHSRVREWQGV